MAGGLKRDRSVGRRGATPPRLARTPIPASGLALPHERDESPDTSARKPDPVIDQAMHDIDAGMVDTDMRASPGLDAELRTRLVPRSRGKRPGRS